MSRQRNLVVLLLLFSLHSAPAFAEIQHFRLLPDASQITAKVDDPFGSPVSGMLRLRQGAARGDLSRLSETGSVTIVIDSASYSSNLGVRDQDIHENALEVRRYPEIRFQSTGITQSEKPRSTTASWLLTLKGDLELHGVKREVVVPLELFYEKNKIVVQGSFRLLMEDFKIAVPRLLFWKAGSQVTVDFRIAGEAQP